MLPYRPSRAGASRPDLLHPSTLAELGGLELLARAVVEGFLIGLHRSPHRGFSAEFAELRAYQPGDDLRTLDWRMFGRSDRFYVKQFEEETNLRATLLLDASASMGWSSEPGTLPPKLWYAKLLAAALSLVLLRQGDAVGVTVFQDQVVTGVEPRGGRLQWKEILGCISSQEAGGGTGAAGALREMAGRMRRRGLVVVVSDLLVDPDVAVTALRYLRHRGHEVLVFHLVDPGERELPPTAQARFVDPETGREMAVRVPDVRAEYRRAVAEALAGWERSLRPFGIDYQVLETHRPLSLALRAYLRKRERLG